MKKFILFIVCLFISTSVYAGPFIAGGGAGTGDMAEATYSTDGKIKASKGGTGKDSSAWDGCYPSLDAGIWSCDDNDTRMQRNIGIGSVAPVNLDGNSSHYLDGSGNWSTPQSDNETLINRLIAEGASDNATIESLIQQSHANNNATNSETRSDQSVTPASLAYWSQNALTTRLMAWLADGTITSIVVGDGNFTVDSSGNVLMRTASYLRDAENPFCQQFYSGTNYDDNYTEFCAPETGYSETYRLYWPAAAPTGNQVMVFPVPTLGKSQGTWQDLSGGGDLVSTNNLSDIDNATAARANLGDGLYLPRIAASGSVTHNHGSIASNSCTDAIDGGTATGTATTDTITWNFSGDPTAITGFGHASSGSLFLYCYPTADHVNIKICNNTAEAIDPGEFVINWIVLRK